jgi:hypothetical protein
MLRTCPGAHALKDKRFGTPAVEVDRGGKERAEALKNQTFRRAGKPAAPRMMACVPYTFPYSSRLDGT